jgi:hypothetical protein
VTQPEALAPKTAPPARTDVAIFDARFRWLIRQEMNELRDLIQLSSAELDGFYVELRDRVVQRLIDVGLNPPEAELATVKLWAKKFVAALRDTLRLDAERRGG